MMPVCTPLAVPVRTPEVFAAVDMMGALKRVSSSSDDDSNGGEFPPTVTVLIAECLVRSGLTRFRRFDTDARDSGVHPHP